MATKTANHGFNGRFMQAGIHKIGSQMAKLGTFEFVFLGVAGITFRTGYRVLQRVRQTLHLHRFASQSAVAVDEKVRLEPVFAAFGFGSGAKIRCQRFGIYILGGLNSLLDFPARDDVSQHVWKELKSGSGCIASHRCIVRSQQLQREQTDPRENPNFFLSHEAGRR